MPCFHPIPARQHVESGTVLITGKHDRWREDRELVLDYDPLNLPCGSCVGCRASRAREWAVRCGLELGFHEDAVWTTLTYDDRHLPPTLRKDHLQGFLKRLRARGRSDRVRFFATGEYGEKRFRPHYHAILFGMRDCAQIQESWPYGHAKNLPVTPATIAYTAGYSSKKLGPRDDPEDRIDYDTGEVYRYQPPFIQMSRRPGIGGDARAFWRSWRSTAISMGTEIPVPRFLHEAWKRHATPSQIQSLKEEKKLKAIDHAVTRYSLQAGEQIALTRHSNRAAKRTL